MPKIVRTSDNDYRIITANSGTITLDTTNATGDDSGQVIVTGDLIVNGGTTTIESTITTIDDSLIVLAAGNTQTGLPAVGLDRPFSAGIEIERGSIANSRWVYDDSIGWGNWGSGQGAWLGTQGNIGNETILPIYTVALIAQDDLWIQTGATGVITVSGTTDYEERVFNYNLGVLEPNDQGRIVLDDDYIPNAKAVKDLVDYSISVSPISIISEDNTSVQTIDKTNVIISVQEGLRTLITTKNSHGYAVNDLVTISGATTSPTDLTIEGINGTYTVTDVPSATTFEILLSTVGGDDTTYVSESATTVVQTQDESRVEVTVEGVNISTFYNNRVNLSDIEIRGTTLFTANSNSDLKISAPGTGVVQIDDTLELPKTPGDDDGAINPSAPADGIRLYSKSPSTGATGLFFVNENENTDEIISKNRALLYGMLF